MNPSTSSSVLVAGDLFLRDNIRNVIGSGAGKIDHYNGALQAEAMAALYGISFFCVMLAFQDWRSRLMLLC